MNYGIANISSIPIRKEPAESSEMRTEIMFGEHFQILETTDRWARILLQFDNYEGWIDKKVIQPISEKYFHELSENVPFIPCEPINYIHHIEKNLTFWVGGGSSFPFFNEDNKTFYLDKDSYEFLSEMKTFNPHNVRKNIIETAKRYLNAAYLWGGRNPFGIDCSGLTQIAYKINGINIPRDASQQVAPGKTVSFNNEAKPGDLAFFDNAEGIITHVGIIIDEKHIIHSSGKVRIDNIDHQGIFNVERNMYTHKLRVIKNLID